MMISVIICTFNREQLIKDCLSSVVNCNNPGCDVEVIVIDNHSSDNTRDRVSQFIAENKYFNVSLHTENRQGLSLARNLGIKKSAGDLLFFLDDDALIDPRCLQRLRFYYEKKGFTCMGGKILPWYRTTKKPRKPVWFNESHWGPLSFLDRGEKVRQVFYPQYPYGANWAVQALLFERYGLLNEGMGRSGTNLISNEEHEFMLRLERGGESIFYVPDVIVYHLFQETRLKLGYFIKRHFAQGISDYIMINVINAANDRYKQLLNRGLEFCLTAPKVLSKILARRRDWAIPLFRIAYNLGFLWSILSIKYRSEDGR